VVKSCHLWLSNPPLQLSMSFFNSIPQFSTFRFSPWSKKNPSNQSWELGQKSFSRSGIPAFNTRYSNGNILSFWYWNQAIQKAQIHLRVLNYNFDEDSKWDKFVLNNRIATKLG
jgi:hypothetical protein